MGLKKITYSLPALKTLLETKNSCVYCIENCHRSLTILPAQLGNLKSSVHEYLSSKVTTCDPELQGIILSHKNVKIIDSVQLNDDGNYRLHYIADTYIFKPSTGSLLTGVVNKKSGDHLGVLVHSVFNASIPRPRVDTGCPKAWAGAGVKIGQQVTFEVTKVNFTSRLPFIKGKLIDIEEKYNEDGGDSGIGGHDSTEEGSSYRSNYEKPLDFNENVKKKKKKKHSVSIDEKSSIDFGAKETSPSTSHRHPSLGRKNSSNLSELQSLLLKEAIATVSNKSTHSEKKKKEKAGLFSYAVNGTLAAGDIEGGGSSKSGRKRKRESSLDLGSSVGDQSTSSLDVPIVHTQHPKVKKKKLSETILNGGKDLDEEYNKVRTPEETERKKKKKKSKNVSSELEKPLGTDIQSTIESLLTFATDSLKPKKKKKSSLLSYQGDVGDSSMKVHDSSSFSYDSKEPADVALEKIKKKKKSCDNMEKSVDLDSSLFIADTAIRLSQTSDNVSSEVEDMKKKKKKKTLVSSYEESDKCSALMSDLSSGSLQENNKKEKKKKKSKSHDLEFLQMENDCIAELLTSKHSREQGTPSEKKKKKKSKHSDVELESSLFASDEMNLSQMPPPATTKIKKKKSSVAPLQMNEEDRLTF